MPPEQPTDAEMRPYDSRAAARDMMTRQFVLACLHSGREALDDDYRNTVDQCRTLARYLQATNEEIDY